MDDNAQNGQKRISSLSICGRLTLNMHSLNNEGGEGNQILTRQITIVDDTGNTHTVSAISGDMLKHIQAQHLFHIATESGLTLCTACKKFDANRISSSVEIDKVLSDEEMSPEHKTAVQQYKTSLKTATADKKREINSKIKEIEQTYVKSDESKINGILASCALDDLEGVLVTRGKNNLPRKSCAEFGWLIGLPEKNKTESYFHVKLVPDAADKGSAAGENTGQNIFHRPANSGIYGAVSNFDIFRIGYNDISKEYVLTPDERNKRYTAFLKSILFTFIEPKGAMRNTQNPHVTDFKGVIAISKGALPAPTISPLNEGYVAEIQAIATSLNKLNNSDGNNSLVEVIAFDKMSVFVNKMQELITSSVPFQLSPPASSEQQHGT